MRPVVSTDSVAAEAVFAAVTGTWSASYPVANLGDLFLTTKVARVTPAAGAAAFTAVLAADTDVQFVAIVDHTMPAGATARIRLYSDAGMTSAVFDSTATAIPTPLARQEQTFPVVLDAAVTVRAVRVDLAGLSGDLDIGALEIAAAWEWPWITAGAGVGVTSATDDIALVGGGSVGRQTRKLRTHEGQVSFLELGISTTTGIDAQKLKGLARPFVFVEDYDTPASWPRSCYLARNTALPAFASALYGHDHFQFRLRKHRQ